MDFIAFDLETTGIDAEADRIVEVGAVRFINFRAEKAYSTLIDPDQPIPAEATQVNGITDEMVRSKPVLQNVLGPLSDFCQDLPLVAHNARFDFGFLEAAIKRHTARGPTGLVLDTFSLAKKVVPGMPNYRLETLVRHFGFPSGTFHRAEEDAAYCGMLFAKIIRSLQASGHPANVADLLELSGRGALQFTQIETGDEQLALF